MVLVSLKILIFGQVMTKKMVHKPTYLGISFLAIFGPIELKCLMGTQETNSIYRLVVRNPSYDAYFSFLGHFWQENGHGYYSTTGCTFWANHYLEIVFSKFARVNPLLLIRGYRTEKPKSFNSNKSNL